MVNNTTQPQITEDKKDPGLGLTQKSGRAKIVFIH
jgi:hypothetical protein